MARHRIGHWKFAIALTEPLMRTSVAGADQFHGPQIPLTPQDFFVWGFVKNALPTSMTLKSKITVAFENSKNVPEYM